MSQDANEGPLARSVRAQLAQLVSVHGVAVLDDARRVRAMLSDAVAGATAETNLVGLAVSSGVPARLSQAGRDPSAVGAAIDAAVQDLERTSSVQRADAAWVVTALAEALGLSAATPPRDGHAEAGGGTPGGAAGPRDLIIRAAGREVVVAPGSVATVGRAPESTIVLESTAISRQHGQIENRDGTWEYTDLKSTQGSFVDGVAVQTVPVQGTVQVTLGQGADSVTMDLVAAGATRMRTPDGPLRPSPRTAPMHDADLRPGGALVAGAGAARTELGQSSPDALSLTLGGTTRTVSPGTTITVGREPGNDLVAAETTVSRRHAQIDHLNGTWQLRDLNTTSGTWLDGRRVTSVPLAGRQEFMLGDAVTGAKLVAQTAAGSSSAAGQGGSTSWLKTRRGMTALVAAVAVAALVAGLLIWQLGGDDTSKPSNDELARATVFLSTPDWTGSGVIIDKKKGLILTNAHVAAPSAVGMGVAQLLFSDEQDPNPKDIVVSVSDGLEHSAEPRFTANLVVADGYLDVAVIKIDRKYSGAQVDESDLAALSQAKLGDSDAIKSTDTVSYFGYPGAAKSERPTYTTGVISSAVKNARLGTNQAAFNSTAIISGGDSGGLAVDAKGRMIGIPTWGRLDDKGQTVFSSFRPINLVKQVIDAAEQGKSYTSPWSSPGPKNAKLSGLSLAAADTPGGISDGCASSPSTAGPLSLGLKYTGFPGGKHTDVLAVLYSDPATSPQEVVTLASTTSDAAYPTSMATSGCLTVTFGSHVPDGRYELKIGVGGDLRVVLDTTLTLS